MIAERKNCNLKFIIANIAIINISYRFKKKKDDKFKICK